MKTIAQFCYEVEKLVEYEIEMEDAGNLCFNLIEAGVISVDKGTTRAAEIVIQHIIQS